jgi:DNA-binding NarL/FixJ family response regulator
LINAVTLQGHMGADGANAIRVLVADDHPLFRAGVVAVVEREPDMEIIAEASDGREVVELYRQHRPDVVLMDLRMPCLGGVEAISLIMAQDPSAHVLVVTSYKGDVEALMALRAGAIGYLLKSAVVKELPLAIRRVSRGQRFVPFEIAEELAVHAVDEALTQREIDVLSSVAAGNSNALVGHALAISEETVKTHMRAILSKLGARDRTHAVAIGLRRGIIGE